MGLAAGPMWRVMEAGVAGPGRAGAVVFLELVKKGRGGGQRVPVGCFLEVRCPGGAWARERSGLEVTVTWRPFAGGQTDAGLPWGDDTVHFLPSIYDVGST